MCHGQRYNGPFFFIAMLKVHRPGLHEDCFCRIVLALHHIVGSHLRQVVECIQGISN